MACTGHRKARQPANLFGPRHRDRPGNTFGVPPAAASNRRLLRSIADLLEVDIAIPDHTTLSRRGVGLAILPRDMIGQNRCILLWTAPA